MVAGVQLPSRNTNQAALQVVVELKEKDIQENSVCKKAEVVKVVDKAVANMVVMNVADVEKEEVNLELRPSHKLL